MRRRSEVVVRDGRLYHLGIAPGEVAPRVFLVGDPARADRVAHRFDRVDHRVTHREYITVTGMCADLPMTVVGTGIGTDNVEIALVELDAAHSVDLTTGVRLPGAGPLHLIRVGTSGGVQPDLPAGTMCVAEYALGLDSTGLYYEAPPADTVVGSIEQEALRLLAPSAASAPRFGGRLPVYASRADPTVAATLLRRAVAAGLACEMGITASTPGFFGPSSRRIDGVANTVGDIKGTLARLSVEGRRVLNMEMESSLLFHLAAVLGHRAGTICPIVSTPDAQAALIDHDRAIDDAIEIAIAAMIDLTGDHQR